MATVELAVVPRASANRVGPYVDGVLRVRVTRPPADGDANRSVLRLVGAALGVPVSSLAVIAGERARRKRLSVGGLTDVELERRLRALPPN
jgi:uncharacterized protein YggU (UPF0235/DUF167 family)